MNGMGTLNFLGVFSFVVGVVKEILIIVLIFKLIKVSNIFIDKKKEQKTSNLTNKANEDIDDSQNTNKNNNEASNDSSNDDIEMKE